MRPKRRWTGEECGGGQSARVAPWGRFREDYSKAERSGLLAGQKLGEPLAVLPGQLHEANPKFVLAFFGGRAARDLTRGDNGVIAVRGETEMKVEASTE